MIIRSTVFRTMMKLHMHAIMKEREIQAILSSSQLHAWKSVNPSSMA